jgi:nucleoid DNA-binding protein
MARVTAIKVKQTKTAIIAMVSEATGLTKKQVQGVLSATKDVAARNLSKNGSGEFTIPELGVKLRRVKKAARKAGKGRNPFTGEEIMLAARPASLSVRATAMKAIKDTVA